MDKLYDLAQTIGGRILPKSRISDCRDIAVGRIVSDSRHVQPGDVFWALHGSNYGGEQFVDEAFRRGARGAVTSQMDTAPDGCWVIHADDTQQALLEWARWKRRKFTGAVVGVTGSVGKATARQMIHTVLQSRLNGIAVPRNGNSRWDSHLSMLAIEPEHDYAVLALEASAHGESTSLIELFAPKVGVITELGDESARSFSSRQGVAEAKTELLAALPSNGQAVLTEDQWLRSLAPRCAAAITWIGAGPLCDLRATDIETGSGRLEFHVRCGNRSQPATGSHGSTKPVRFSIPVWGRHHIPAALSAVAVGRMLGFDFDEIAAALSKYDAAPTRCEVVEIRGAMVINDTRNVNPPAIRAALELLRDFDVAGRRIMICGDIAGPSPKSIELHWRMGKDIVQIGGAELVIACGDFARHVTAGTRAAGLDRARAVPCETVEAAMPYIGQVVMPGDAVLVKGSPQMAMQRVIESLKGKAAKRMPVVYTMQEQGGQLPKARPKRRRSA
jgi:UDP-N-acetylmuramoyl-tripeptide--D-alanyl-D-alanine ligase